MIMFCAVVLAAQNFNVAPSLRGHIEYLCSDELEGRAAGSEGERLAAEYVFRCLENAGVVMLCDKDGQDFTISSPQGDIKSCNILGIVEGSDPVLRNEYIVVGAHFDHLGTNSLTVNGEKVTQVYRGADSNASGTAILIELAKIVAQYQFMFPRSIIFVGFGAGEQGTAGSWYFVNRAFEQIRDVKAMIDLDMLGRSGKKNPFQTFSQMKSLDFDYLLDQTLNEPVVTRPEKASQMILSSDYLPFYEKKIPVVLFTNGSTRELRTVKDTPGLLEYDSMERECNYIYHFLRVLACQEQMPSLEQEKQIAQEDEKIYSMGECDMKPQFFHSDEKHFLASWVYKYVKYPKAAIERNIHGTVYVSFVIEKDGSLTNVTVEKSVDELLDDEAVKAISVSPKWIPGQIKGRKVRTRIVIPVEFRLK